MPDEPKPDRKKIQEAYEKAIKTFGQRENVTGIDVGYKYDAGERTDMIAVRIHVREKKPIEVLSDADIFPKDIDGVPVDVIQGHYSPSAEGILALLARRHRRNPIQPGISVSHSLVSAGTLARGGYDRTTRAPA